MSSSSVQGCKPSFQFTWGSGINQLPYTVSAASSNPVSKPAGKVTLQLVLLGGAGPYQASTTIQATLDEQTAIGQGAAWINIGTIQLNGTFPTAKGLFLDTAAFVMDAPYRGIRVAIASLSGAQAACLMGSESWPS